MVSDADFDVFLRQRCLDANGELCLLRRSVKHGIIGCLRQNQLPWLALFFLDLPGFQPLDDGAHGIARFIQRGWKIEPKTIKLLLRTRHERSIVDDFEHSMKSCQLDQLADGGGGIEQF